MGDSDERAHVEADSVVTKAWHVLREGFDWFADTFRGHAHVRDLKEERE